MIYRELARDEIPLLAGINRRETIHHIYYFRDGSLVQEEEFWLVPDWGNEQVKRRIKALVALFDQGALFFGAYAGGGLVGMAVLDLNFIGSGSKRLNLSGLWVGEKYRHKGIGKRLFNMAVEQAQCRGALSLYISATPSENTVNFYQSQGCILAEPIDETLYAQEPEDIHFELPLGMIEN